ncbi:MAG: hypothetical protein K8R63_11975 [Bacteroidales bacterium]|nr:hypothetical protein [Bacteroidales bacterium]
METKKIKTIDIIKEKRTVSAEAKQNLKEYNKIKKLILKSLESEAKTIPQIAAETELPLDVVTFYLMTLRRYGSIETGEIDDMDEYFSYKLKK